jgi:hypothetical protein
MQDANADGEAFGDWFTGVMMSVFGLVGLIMAIGARDIEISVFGWSLAGFAVVFVGALARARFALAPIASQQGAPAQGGTHG